MTEHNIWPNVFIYRGMTDFERWYESLKFSGKMFEFTFLNELRARGLYEDVRRREIRLSSYAQGPKATGKGLKFT